MNNQAQEKIQAINLLSAAGKFKPVLNELSELEELAKKNKQDDYLLQAYLIYIKTYIVLGRLEEAIATGTKALEIFKQRQDFKSAIYAEILCVRGLAYYLLGDIKFFKEHAQASLNIAKQQGYAAIQAQALDLLGLYQLETIHDIGQAEEYFTTGLNLLKTKTHDEAEINSEDSNLFNQKLKTLAKLQIDLSRAWLNKGEYNKAEQALRQIMEETKEQRFKILCLLYLSFFYFKQEQYDLAEGYSKKALEAAQNSFLPLKIGESHWILGKIYHAVGNIEAAKEAYAAALQVFQEHDYVLKAQEIAQEIAEKYE